MSPPARAATLETDPVPLGALVAAPPPERALPNRCARCLAPAAATERLRGPRGRCWLVPLCAECGEHRARAVTRGFALRLACWALAGLGGLLGPWLLPWSGVLAHLLVAATPPALLLVLAARFPIPGTRHGVAGRAPVRYVGSGNLWCESPGFAELLGGPVTPAAEPPSWPAVTLGGCGALAVTAALASRAVLLPEVRVLNLGEVTLELEIDGVPRVSVPPTPTESPTAGIVLRLLAGKHRVTGRTPSGEELLPPHEVHIELLSPHLYVLARGDQCFWTETRTYGDGAHAEPVRVSLGRDRRLWALPGVDRWLEPLPEPGPSRATGGKLTAVRHAPCDDAPSEVR